MSARALATVGIVLWIAATTLRVPALRTDDATPVAAGTVALGALGPMLTDLLWLRAAEQQEAGQYFAMAETTRLIAKLQPNSAGLVIFEARNAAFNLAEQFSSPDQRWFWIEHGLKLLVDGLVRQPNEPAIDENIATILLGRVADQYDPASVQARLHFAQIWRAVVSRGTDGRYTLREKLDAEPWQSWRMDVGRVREVDRRYGPLDWRLPEAHAIYWTTEAIRKAGGEARRPIAARMRYQALWAAFQGGRMILIPDTGRLELLPDSRLLTPLEAEMLRLRRVLPDNGELQIADRNIARDALLVLYLEGQVEFARARMAVEIVDPQAALEQAVLTAAGWDPSLPPAAAADVVTGWLAASIRMRDVGAADLARGWERVAELACQKGGEQLPPFQTLMERALSEGK